MSPSSCFTGLVLRGHPSVFVYLATARSQDSDLVDSGELHLSNEPGAMTIGWKTAVKVNNI